jgi:hypothetical protein
MRVGILPATFGGAVMVLEVFFAVPLSVMFRDSLEVRDVAMPHGINTIHLKEGFQVPQFLIGHKGHGNA